MDYASQTKQAGLGIAAQIPRPCDVPKRETEISREVCRLDDRLQRLRKTIEDLALRISPIVANVPRPDNNKTDCARSTDFGNLLGSYNNKLEDCIEALESIIERVEL